MKRDVVLAGVGGQGVLSVAALLAACARDAGLHVKQGEVHGMAQRGGAVQAHLRMADAPVHSELISRGAADLLLSMELLESLRWIDWLSRDGWLVTARETVQNLDGYPDAGVLLERVAGLPHALVVDTLSITRRVGLAQSANVVMLGAACPFLPIVPERVEARLAAAFERKGPRVVGANLAAFRAGLEAAGLATV